jgi:hypothetical protein
LPKGPLRKLKVSFSVPAEVAPESSPGAAVTAQVTELGLQGCYLEIAAPFAEETRVLLKIFKAGEYFEARATVVSVDPKLGMGLAFREIKPHFAGILQRWILGAMHQQGQPQEC